MVDGKVGSGGAASMGPARSAMWMTPRRGAGLLGALLGSLLGAPLAGCSIERAVFTPETTPADAQPDATRPSPQEDCAAPGDEDGNGVADCADPACTTSPACHCGDGIVDTMLGEEVDPPTSPSTVVGVDPQTCRFDFSQIAQLYCAYTCGTWGGGNGCQQEDADALCRLKTGDPTSTALSFALRAASAAPGICCPTIDPTMTGCTLLPPFADRGVMEPVAVHDTDLASSHGAGQVVSDVVCSQ